MPSLGACTVASINYLAHARVLAQSFLRHHPEARFFLLLVDRLDGAFDVANEPFTVIEVKHLSGFPEVWAVLFKYSQIEALTALKPFLLAHLFETHGFDRLLYLDADILVTRPLDNVVGHGTQHSLFLTPHLTDPIDDDRMPDEVSILGSGTYNMGFLGLSNTPTSREFLNWWKRRLVDNCLDKKLLGLFMDQKWIDLAPALFDGVHVLTDPGYNVAYWNLNSRRISLNGEPQSNGNPLYFFHFSGLDLDNIEGVSRYQDRFTLGDIGDAAKLFRKYRELVLAEGFDACRSRPYAFASFDNGVPIPSFVREFYRSLGPAAERFGDPFKTGPADSFFRWLNQPNGPRLSRHWYVTTLFAHMHEIDAYLRARFPWLDAKRYPYFCQWLADQGAEQYGLASSFLRSARLFDDSAPDLPAPRLRRLMRRLLGRKRAFELWSWGHKVFGRRAAEWFRTRSARR